MEFSLLGIWIENMSCCFLMNASLEATLRQKRLSTTQMALTLKYTAVVKSPRILVSLSLELLGEKAY